jgi:hypothetical protein
MIQKIVVKVAAATVTAQALQTEISRDRAQSVEADWSVDIAFATNNNYQHHRQQQQQQQHASIKIQ